MRQDLDPLPALANPTSWPLTWAPFLARITAAYLAVGILALMAWQFTGNSAWIIQFFRIPAAILMVWLALTEFWLTVQIIGHFDPDDLLRPGWILIACSAGCQLVGMIFSQVLGVDSSLNPLAKSRELLPLLHSVGLLIGGTFRFALLAGGLHFALKAYQRAGFLSRLSWIDWTVFAGFAVFIARNVADVVVAVRHGKTPGTWEVLGWPVDPLLLLLLFQALLLLRSARQMNNGRISLCWKAYAAGVFLTALGDIGIWATNYGYLHTPWNAFIWYVWLPAATAFARGAAFQLEVILNGRTAARPFLWEVLKLSES